MYFEFKVKCFVIALIFWASIFAFGFRFIFTNRLNCVNLENWGLYLEERLYKKYGNKEEVCKNE